MAERPDVLITTTFGDAIHYTLTYWPYFERFLTDPRIRLDNNHTERSLRGPVLGRKNYYGSKSRRGTEVAAMFYTLMETAKLHGIDPMKYLVLAARRGARDEAVLPWEFDPGELDSR
jgi:transposase